MGVTPCPYRAWGLAGYYNLSVTTCTDAKHVYTTYSKKGMKQLYGIINPKYSGITQFYGIINQKYSGIPFINNKLSSFLFANRLYTYLKSFQNTLLKHILITIL